MKHPSLIRAEQESQESASLRKLLVEKKESVPKDVVRFIDKPLTSGMLWWKKYFCPDHPTVELKVGEYYEREAPGVGVTTTVYYDGCGYVFWKIYVSTW